MTTSLPFEDDTLPWFTGLTRSIGLFARRPREAFERMSPDGSLAVPGLFAVVLGSFGWIVEHAWDSLFARLFEGTPLGREMFVVDPFSAAGLELTMISFGVMLAGIVLAPLYLHGFMVLFRAGGRGPGATFRVYCYSHAAFLLRVVPLISSILVIPAFLILLTVGLAVSHGVSTMRAAGAVLVAGAIYFIGVVGFFAVMLMPALRHL